MRPTRLLVLDMDNTLFDWRAHFCAVFKPLVAALSDLVGESPTLLKQQFREIHQQEGHMECASATRRLPSLAAWLQGEPARIYEMDLLIRRFIEFGRSNLHPYPGVEETLRNIVAMGWTVVVFTESPAMATAERLQGMNLFDLVDVVYGAQGLVGEAPPPHMRFLHLPAFAKPAPEILRSIVKRHHASLASTIYVGDSLRRDMPMARAAGVTGVWARYGSYVHEGHKRIISEVSCWAATKVHQEFEHLGMQECQPDCVIDSFAELAAVAQTQQHGPRR
jgi:FMN phosphatase YigB (HAD superfamily)